MATTYNDNWEGKTGRQVREIIQDALNNHSVALDNTISGDLTFTPDDDGQTVHYTYVQGGVTKDKQFTLIPRANASMTLTINNNEEFSPVVGYGNGFTIPYQFEIKNEQLEKIPNISASITVTINGKSIEKGKSVLSKVGTNLNGSITILGSELYVGENQIVISFSADYMGGKVYAASQIQAEVIDLKLTCSLSKDVNQVYSSNETFTINHTVSGTNKLVYTRIYWGGNYLALDELTGANTSVTFSQLRNGAISNSQSAQNLSATGLQRIFVQSYVAGTDIVSNIAGFYVLSLANAQIDGTYLTAQFEVSQIGTIPIIPTSQYSPFQIKLYAYTSNRVLVKTTLNGTELGEGQTVLPNLSEETFTNVSFDYNFKTVGEYNLSFLAGNNININQNTGIDFSLQFKVNVSSIGTSIDEPTGITLNLSAKGQSGTVNSVWKYGNYTTTFSPDFDWMGSGWKTEGNESYLLLTNGASAVINYDPCSTTTYTASFRFKVESSIREESLIECLSENTGFVIYPEKAIIYNAGASKSTEFNSDVIHELTFVSYGDKYQNLMCIYIDGCIQAVAEKSSLAKHNSQTGITIQSTYNTLKIYDITCYNRPLSFTEVQSLYSLHLNDSEAVQNYVKKNNVFNIDTSSIGIYGDDVTIDKLPVGSIYIVIESYKADGESTSLDPTPWKTINGYLSDSPDTYKGIRHFINSIKLIKKNATGQAEKMNFYAEHGTLSAQGTSSMQYPAKNFRFYFKKTINENCPYYNSVSISGDKPGDFGFTSRMWINIGPNFVPDDPQFTGTLQTDNLGKAKYSLYSKDYEQGDEYTSAPANVFCLKADFAESSGTHNTGFARLAHYALTNSSNICSSVDHSHKLPQQAIQDETPDPIWKYDIRSTIDGMAVYLFFKEFGQSDAQAVYYGKYNLNNEKASEDIFGFQGAVDYYNNPTVQAEAAHLKELFNDTQDAFALTHMKYSIKSNKYDSDGTDYINPNECWEFSNNTFTLNDDVGDYTNLGAFQYPYAPDATYPLYRFQSYRGKDPFTVRGVDGSYAWLSYNDGSKDYGQAWEYRFPGWETKAGEEDTAHIYYVNGGKPLLLYSLYKWIHKHNIKLWGGDQQASVATDFARDLHLYFNINYLLKYFVLTKWFGNTDQRIKNCMLGIYCDPYAADNTNREYPMGHMRAFYIFYDNDTILGVGNDGSLSNAWNIDESKYPGYNIHGVWSSLQYCYDYYINTDKNNILLSEVYNLGQLIENAYKTLRQTINDGKLEKFFETDLCDKYPDAIFNVDAEIKYYFPLERLTKQTGMNNIPVPNRVQNIQGNRKHHRARWLTKRTNWLDAMYNAGNVFEYRYSFKTVGVAGSGDGGSIKLTSAIPNWRFYALSNSQLLDSSGLLNSQTSYSYELQLGNSLQQVLGTSTTDPTQGTITINGNIVNNYSIGNVVIYNNIAYQYNGTYWEEQQTQGNISVSDFVHLQGLYACSEIDFTNLVINSSIVDLTKGSPLPYMKKLIVSKRDNPKVKYFHPDAFLKLVSGDLFPNLEELYICKIAVNPEYSESQNLGTINLSALSHLKQIDATGTVINITLPDSQSLTALYLEKPTTIELKNKPYLTSFSINDTSALNSIIIKDGNSVVSNKYLLQLAIQKLNSNAQFSVTIELGKDNDYEIDYQNELPYLEQLADKKLAGSNNVVARGTIYSEYITAELQEKLENAFPELIANSTSTEQFGLSADKATLREGESITIRSTKVLENANAWHWSIGNETIGYSEDTTFNDNLTIEKTATKIKFTFAQSVANNSNTYYLNVSCSRAFAGESQPRTVNIENIPVVCIPVQSVEIRVTNNLLDVGENESISMVYTPSNHTKSNLLQFTSSNWSCSHGSVSDNIFYMGDSGADSSVYLDTNLLNPLTEQEIHSNTINFVFNRQLATLSGGVVTQTQSASNIDGQKSQAELKWIYNVLNYKLGADTLATIQNIKIKTLRDVDIANALTAIPKQDGQNNIIHDLQYLEYFGYTNSTFNIPNVYFNNLNIPESGNVTTVNWNLSDSTEATTYNKITFNRDVNNVNININTNTPLTGLKLDFSKCKNITTIKNGSGSNTANISITYQTAQDNSISAGGNIFVYPPNLEVLGNYSDNDDNNYPATMFNLINNQGSSIVVSNDTDVSAIVPIYKIGSVGADKDIKLGALFGYLTTLPSETFTHPVGNIISTYYSFYNLNLRSDDAVQNGMNFTKLVRIGSHTFDSVRGDGVIVDVILPASIKIINGYAFRAFKGNITSTSSSNNIQQFRSLEKIGAYAFAGVARDLSISLKSESLSHGGIGDNAFTLFENNSGSCTIYIDKENNDVATSFAWSGNSFGAKQGNRKNKLYITSALNTIMSGSIQNYNTLKNNVDLYVDNVLQN